MEGPDLVRQLASFDPALPLDRAWTPPSSWYTSPAIFELERRAVFASSWHFAARKAQLERPGSFVSGMIAGEPFVVVRDKGGELRALSNVCRHHAAEICRGEGELEQLVCPYHGWTYELDGRLARAPELGAARDFERERFALPHFAVATLGPWVFVSLAAQPSSLVEDSGELMERFAPSGLERLRYVARQVSELACNWKVYVDNYLDGGYHVARLHPGLARELDLGGYRTEVFSKSALQTGPGATHGVASPSVGSTHGVAGPSVGSTHGVAGPSVGSTHGVAGSSGGSAPGAEARVGEGALYGWLHPNFMINRYGPVMDTNLVVPLAVDRTRVVMDFYFLETEGPRAKSFIAQSLAASEAVQREDVDICESVQRGVASRSYDRGRYSVAREGAMHRFHVLLARQLADSAR